MTILAYAPFVLQLLLLWQLVRTRAYRSFPWFFAYTFFSGLATVARFIARDLPITYFYIYWTTDVAYSVLGLAVLYEVCRRVLRNLGRGRSAYLTFILMIAAAAVLTLVRTQGPLSGGGRLLTAAVAAELGVRFLQVLVFLVLLVAVAVLGVRWRQHPFGISAGYGIYASVNLFTTTRYYESGTNFTSLWGWVSVLSYTIAVLIWLWYFGTPIKADAPNSEQPPLSLRALERYKEIARRVPRP